MSFLDDDASMAGLSAEQIVEAMKGPAANGTATLDAASQAHGVVHAGHAELESMTNSLIGTMTAAWRGDAADLAHSRIHPMLATLRLSQEDLAKAQDLTSRQSGSFHDAANALVPVPPKPSNNVVNALTPWHTDLDGQIDQWNEAQSRNIAVYTSYTSASNYNHDGMPTSYGDVSTFGAPANVHITSAGGPTPGPGHGSVGGFGPGHVPGGSFGHGSDTGNGPGGGMVGGPGVGGAPGSGSSSDTGNSDAGGPAGADGPGGGTGDGLAPSAQGPGSAQQPGTGGQVPVIPGGSTTAQGYHEIPTQPTGQQWNQPSYGTPSGGGGAAGGGSFATFGSGASNNRGSQPRPGDRAGVGAAGKASPRVVGRRGAAGETGANGMPGPTAQGGKKEEDREHRSAVYLDDDYSDDIVGELPYTTPPVIGLD